MSDEWYQEWQTEEKAYEDKWQYAVEEHIKTVNAASHPEARTTFPDQRTRPEDGDPQNPQAGESVMIAPTAREDMRTASIGRNVIKIAPAIMKLSNSLLSHLTPSHLLHQASPLHLTEENLLRHLLKEITFPGHLLPKVNPPHFSETIYSGYSVMGGCCLSRPMMQE